MSIEPETLRSRLHQLRQAGHSLADLLTLDADRMDADGWPPSRVLSDDLRRFREQVSSLTVLLNSGFDDQGTSQYWSLNQVDTELEYRETALQALAVARKMIQITPPDGQILTSLTSLQDTAREMIASRGWQQDREQIHALAEGRHPWCDLLQMIHIGTTLPDSEWTSLNTSIESALGHSLAVAAARGRLQLPFLVGEAVIRLPEAEQTPGSPVDSTRTPSIPVPAIPFRSQTLTSPLASLAVQSLDSTPQTNSQGSSTQTVCGSEPVTGPVADEVTAIPVSHLNCVVEAPDIEVQYDSQTHQSVAASYIDSISVQIPMEDVQIKADANTALISEVVNAAESGDVSNSSQSVFEGIEPALPDDNLTVQQTTPLGSIASTRTWQSTSPFHSSSSSIFEDESEDELVMSRDDEQPLSKATQHASDHLVPVPSPLAEKLLDQARFSEATGPSASLAQRILNGLEADRGQLLPDLILHLIHEGRPGLAFHLSRSLESRSEISRQFVPSWLIRTWTYGRALVLPKGQLAGLLQDDLQIRAAIGLREDSRDWNVALSLLARAATLRPAIIAPATRAASVLRDFELHDGCVQLYNYCSRIGAYGERVQGIFPGLFKQSSTSVPYSDQLSTLQSDVANWQESSDTQAMKYQIATQLFQKTGWSLRAGTSQRQAEVANDWMNWQIALQMSESLVTPVLEDCRTEFARVKADLEQISTKLSANHSSDERRQLTQPEIRAYLRQATTFAERWIGLHSGAATTEAQNYLPQAAVELRSEIQNRHEPVMAELRKMATEHTSFEVRMAVSCLMLSVQDVFNLVDSRIPIDAREADPRHLLHSELLKIPDLSFNSNWEPGADFHSLEDEILRFLSQPQPDWATAFKMQLAQGSHQQAERILSLSVWTNCERQALHDVMERDRLRQRTDFVQELSEVEKLLAESVHLDILQDMERASYEARLLKLQHICSSDSDVSAGLVDLKRVRESLVIRRDREADRIRARLRQLSSRLLEEQAVVPASNSVLPPSSSRGWVMDFDQ